MARGMLSAVIRQIAPQFFTTNLRATLAYYTDKLGFDCLGTWHDPPVYAIVARDKQRIHFRHADPPTCNPDKYADEYGEAAPHTGDNPNSAVLIKVTAACASVTAVPNFRLPPQVRRDTSSPIECMRVRANGAREVLQTNMQGACSQFPLQNPWNLPNVFAWAGLAAGESLEVYMPIEYISVAAPASFSAEIRHSIQQNDPLFPIIQFNVGYAARFKNYAVTDKGRGRGSRWGSWDGERIDISFALHHYPCHIP
jgi:hypothetical protein